MKVNIDPAAVEEVLTRGVVDCIPVENLRTRLLSGERLRIKFGIDPTSPHLHLGHTVPLRKLRQFQDLGHQAVLIIGDATAMIGDPTGRTEARKKLERSEIDEHKKTYVGQASKILDFDTLEIHHNGEWFDGMGAAEFLSLTSLVTVQQVLQREDFRQRVDDEDHPLTTLEMTYPIMQGYDSVMVKADIEIGGHDQLLNLHMGRRLQRRFSQPEQGIVTVPLVEGTDGERKMSKSFGNAIFLESTADDMFGHIMSIPDSLIIRYFVLVTDASLDEIANVERSLASGGNPRESKALLAWRVVGMYHGRAAADAARIAFDERFREGALPEEIAELHPASSVIVDVLLEAGFVPSRGEAKRQIEQGGVKIDGVVVSDLAQTVPAGAVVQKGKRHFVRIVA